MATAAQIMITFGSNLDGLEESIAIISMSILPMPNTTVPEASQVPRLRVKWNNPSVSPQRGGRTAVIVVVVTRLGHVIHLRKRREIVKKTGTFLQKVISCDINS